MVRETGSMAPGNTSSICGRSPREKKFYLWAKSKFVPGNQTTCQVNSGTSPRYWKSNTRAPRALTWSHPEATVPPPVHPEYGDETQSSLEIRARTGGTGVALGPVCRRAHGPRNVVVARR